MYTRVCVSVCKMYKTKLIQSNLVDDCIRWHTECAQIVHVSVVPYSYLCGISSAMIYLGSFSVKNCEIFMGLIYPFMLCMCYVHVFIAGEYSWQDKGGGGGNDDDGGRLFSCNFIRSGRFHYRAKMVVVFRCIILQYERNGASNAHKLTQNDRQIDTWPHLTIKNYHSNSIRFFLFLFASAFQKIA